MKNNSSEFIKNTFPASNKDPNFYLNYSKRQCQLQMKISIFCLNYSKTPFQSATNKGLNFCLNSSKTQFELASNKDPILLSEFLKNSVPASFK